MKSEIHASARGTQRESCGHRCFKRNSKTGVQLAHEGQKTRCLSWHWAGLLWNKHFGSLSLYFLNGKETWTDSHSVVLETPTINITEELMGDANSEPRPPPDFLSQKCEVGFSIFFPPFIYLLGWGKGGRYACHDDRVDIRGQQDLGLFFYQVDSGD